MDSNSWSKVNIHYYLREKYYEKAQKLSNIASNNSADPEYKFYCGISFVLEGQSQKGIKELTPLQTNNDLNLAIIMAFLVAHKKNPIFDRETLSNLESKLKEERKHSTAASLYYAGIWLSLADKFEKASDYITKSLRKDPNNNKTLFLKGWNDIYMHIGNVQMSVLDCFDLGLAKNPNDVEALLGLAKCKYYAHDFDGAIQLLNKLIVNDPGQVVPLTEKLINNLAMKKWDAVSDTMDRVFNLDTDSIAALKVRIFITLCKNGDYIEASDQLNKFFDVLELTEQKNSVQFFEVAKLFSRACGRSSTVLSHVYRFIQHASELQPNNVDYLSEIGYQCLLQGKNKDAQSFFKAASKIDSNSISALCGLTLSQMIETGANEQIAQQIELLFEMQGNSKLPLLLLLSAKLNLKSSSKAIPFLDDAAEILMNEASKVPYSVDYVMELDPDLLLEVYKEYQRHLPEKPFVITGCLMYTQNEVPSTVRNCIKILETICNACPGLLKALYELANLKFLFGFANEAQKLAETIIGLDSTHAGSHVLMAQIYIMRSQFSKASQSMEMCLSYNFKIRDSAMYHLINGVIMKNSDQMHDASSSFSTALSVANNRAMQTNRSNFTFAKSLEKELNIVDKATLYLELIEAKMALDLNAEVGKLLQDAIQEFSYTSEEGRLVLAKAELALKKADVDKAIDILNEVKFGQPYYFQAHKKLAHIYLKEKGDSAMFTACFKEIVSNHPMADSHTMMGDAYMEINEPALAVESYENALKTSSQNNEALIRKLGAALFKTHDYSRAVNHYENAIDAVPDDQLKYEYFELLVKLKQYDKADAAISKELALSHNREKDLSSLRRRVKYLLLQAKARDLKKSLSGNTMLILVEAKELQTSIVKRTEIDSTGNIEEERSLLSEVLCLLAQSKSMKEPAVAANLYSEALLYLPKNPRTLLALAKLYAQMGNTEKCSQTCGLLLSAEPNNESAAVMMADLAFRKVDFEAAHRHLAQVLSVKPCAWEALAQLVEVQWRRGKLDELEQALDAAKLALGTKEDLGYSYCLGIYSAYAGKPNVALRLLNQCRMRMRANDAATRMIHICLTQDSSVALSDSPSTSSDAGDTRLLAIRTAEKLLPEVAAHDRKPLQALIQLATGQKAQAEKVLQDLLPFATDDEYVDDPWMILAIANAYNIIKQPTRAKNILKRTTASIAWTPEKAEGLERCWLEVAEGQISAGRTEQARATLTKIIAHNNSCAHAYQLLGHVSEKEQNYKVAAHSYDSAWRYSYKSNLANGYKLAHCYLKLKKYPEAIIVCRDILKVHPDYPKIKKEILEKAKTNLRT